MPEDFYKVLGVKRDASKADIKRAYRKLAQEHHPDKGGDEKKFKKANEAYEVLSDDQKRAHYDQFGSAAPHSGGTGGASGFDFGKGGFSGFSTGNVDFSGMEDIFSSFFGGGRSQSRRSGTTKGSDLEVEIEIDFDEAVRSTTKSFSSRNFEPCSSCHAKGGEGQKKCATCGGSGSVAQRFQTPFGTVAQQRTCPDCQGQGESFEKICPHCHGEGRFEEKGKIEVQIPSGVENGAVLRFSGKGEAGVRGGSKGDLYVHIFVRPSRKFERRGLDLLSALKISVFDALGGGKFPVETFWGRVTLIVPECTRDGQLLRIREKGIRSEGRVGDHLVRIEYEMPKKISTKLRDLLEKVKKEA